MSDYQVGPETFISIEYSVFDAEGDVVADGNRLACVFGRGQLLPSIERALDGLSVGASRTLKLAARDAYGKRDPKAVLEVERSEFPEDVSPGDRFEVENDEGQVLVLQVLDVGPDSVHVDMNHPLAGQDVRIELRVVEVRPATDVELQEADEALEAQSELEQAEAWADGPLPEGPTPTLAGAASGLVSVERLLRGPSRSYEKGPAEVPHPAEPKSGDADEH